MSRLLDIAMSALAEAEKLRPAADADRLALEVEDLREHFEERVAILEHDGQLPRDVAEPEAARMAATLARNRRYSWTALRLAFRDYPAILAQLPDRSGNVNALPLGVAVVAIHPALGVIPQGVHRELSRRLP